VSTERAHALSQRAEDQALRRVHERQRVAPSPKSDPGKDCAARSASSRRAEAAVAALESEVVRVVTALETRPSTRGPKAPRRPQARAQLENLKRDLDAGLERVTQATEQVEMRAATIAM